MMWMRPILQVEYRTLGPVMFQGCLRDFITAPPILGPHSKIALKDLDNEQRPYTIYRSVRVV